MKSFSVAMVALILSTIACVVELAVDVLAEPLVAIAEEIVPVDVENELSASVMEGNVKIAFEDACVVVAGGAEGICSTPSVLLPTTTGDFAFMDVEDEVVALGLLSAAMRASMVEEPVVVLVETGVVEIVVPVTGGKGAGGSAAMVGPAVVLLPEPLKSPPSICPRPCPSCIPSIIFIMSPPKRLFPPKGEYGLEAGQNHWPPMVLQSEFPIFGSALGGGGVLAAIGPGAPGTAPPP